MPANSAHELDSLISISLTAVTRGRGGVYPDGYVYAIASEREFNASNLILGRARPDVADMTVDTGNARRGSYAAPSRIGAANFHLGPGKTGPDDLVRDLVRVHPPAVIGSG